MRYEKKHQILSDKENKKEQYDKYELKTLYFSSYMWYNNFNLYLLQKEQKLRSVKFYLKPSLFSAA